MTRHTRREFIRRGMVGVAGLGSAGAGRVAARAPSTPALLARGPQVVAPHPTEIVITSTPVRENFCGVGFHAQMFLDVSTQDFFEQVLAKRWRELNPRFARLFHQWQQDHPGVRDPKVLDPMARQLVFMNEAAGTEIYVTTADLKPVASEEERRAYSSAVVDDLEYLLNRGATNLKYYCCTNQVNTADPKLRVTALRHVTGTRRGRSRSSIATLRTFPSSSRSRVKARRLFFGSICTIPSTFP